MVSGAVGPLHCVCVSLAEQVTAVSGTERRKFPPFPLNTLELQKRASRYLRMPSEHTMKVCNSTSTA